MSIDHSGVSKNILVVDDDAMQRALLERFIKKIGHNPILVGSGKDAETFFTENKQIDKISYLEIDVVLLDISMPGLDGFQVLEKIRAIRGDLPVIMLTALKDSDLAIRAIGKGAFDYIVKGEADVFARLSTALGNAIEQKKLRNEVALSDRSRDGSVSFSDIISKSPKTKSIISLLLKTVDLDIPILLQGENGVGKELYAKAIHGSGHRANKPFVIVNCGAISKDLADSVLFGYEKGFMGNMTSSKGKFREAEGGTLFLDNVGELKPETQLKLLNVLKKEEIEPLGSNESVKINVRIISTASKFLEEEVKKGTFRPDLFYRLNVFSVNIPSLRDRREEIEPLAKSFCYSFSISEHKKIKGITDKALKVLNEYDWPGNIRQLRNIIFRAVILAEGDEIDVKHLPAMIQSNLEYQQTQFREEEYVKLIKKKGVVKRFKDIETEIIEKIIKICNGNISEAAKMLEVGRSTLYRKISSLEEKQE